ncbi:plasmid mobilization protein (plasmid) [Xanthomonas citri pv. citri]|uniref:plasmid mobilization protein n=1 Tax=Xanthomonas citri TaxID=346 RepID=UPI001C636245|nr:plasmid mobilization protein [Xanthomonas citri]QYF42632.1 plasmid mobilization protein [Xanthomonas citri pv. citri]QYF42658.1 plasmid mobilization protein [Xanthomonas citri pv. citri]
MATERLESLKAKKAQLAAQIAKLEARESDKARKERTKALILFGTALEKQLKKGDQDGQLRSGVRGAMEQGSQLSRYQ